MNRNYQNYQAIYTAMTGLMFSHSYSLKKGTPDTHYPFIPYNMNSFMDFLDLARKKLKSVHRRRNKFKFIDVGCGLGVTVSLAYSKGWDAFGVELSEDYANSAKTLMRNHIASNNRIFHEDALNFPSYHEYDCIYFFQPIADFKLQKKLEEKIYKEAKESCVLIVPQPVASMDELVKLKCPQRMFEPPIWFKPIMTKKRKK